MPEIFLSKNDVAKWIGVSPITVNRMAHQKDGLKAYKFGKQLRFRESDVIAYLEAHEVKPAEKAVAMPGMGHFHYEVGMRVV